MGLNPSDVKVSKERKKALLIINMGTSLMQNTIVVLLLSNEQICNTKNNRM